MEEPFSYRLGLTLASYFAVWFLMAYSEVRAQIQDRSSAPSSPCVAQNQPMQNFSFIGKPISAECFCKQSIESDQLKMCAAWKLSCKPFQETSDIKIFTKYSKEMLMSLSQAVNSKSCEEYTQNIIHGIYGSTKLNFSTVQEAISYSINWDFCEDMHIRNNTGCNYTIVQATGQNNSVATRRELFYFVPSFTSNSQHLRLGNFYRLNFDKYNGTIANVCVSALDNSLSPSETMVDFTFFPTKRRRISTRFTETKPDKAWKRNKGIHYPVLPYFYTYTMYAAILLALLFKF